MCTLIVVRNRIEGLPLLVGANRDEYRDRPWRGPRRVGEVVAPGDLRAGGTWLAVHDAGLLIAVTNRPEPDFDPERPSRGLLAMDLARTGGVEPALALLRMELSRERRNGFRALIATANAAFSAAHPGPDGTGCEVREVPDGVHTLTNLRGLDELPVRQALDPLRSATSKPDALEALRRALGTHDDRGPPAPDTICKHGEERGTLSSAIVGLSNEAPPLLLFAGGAPCETEFAPVTRS